MTLSGAATALATASALPGTPVNADIFAAGATLGSLDALEPSGWTATRRQADDRSRELVGRSASRRYRRFEVTRRARSSCFAAQFNRSANLAIRRKRPSFRPGCADPGWIDITQDRPSDTHSRRRPQVVVQRALSGRRRACANYASIAVWRDFFRYARPATGGFALKPRLSCRSPHSAPESARRMTQYTPQIRQR